MAVDNAAPAAPHNARHDLTRCTVRIDGNRAVVTVAGEIDMSSASTVRDMCLTALSSDTLESLHLDLAGVTFCDSAGIDLLVDVAQLLRDRGGRLQLENVTEPVHRLLVLFNLSSLLSCEPSPCEPGG